MITTDIDMDQLCACLKQIGKAEMGLFPTPLHRLRNLEETLRFEKIFIKRDDMTGLGPGGNKVRSLEFIMRQVLDGHHDLVIVSGPMQSNLCTLAANACARLRVECVIVHNGEEPEHYTGNELLNQISRVKTYYAGNISRPERDEYVERLSEAYRTQGRRPYVIENGATTGFGALGYVNAAAELLRQNREQGLEIHDIFVPGGNGGVAAGLIYGNAWLGCPFCINVVSVDDELPVLYEGIRETVSQIGEITGISIEGIRGKGYNILDDYRGGGWGSNTPESVEAVLQFPREEGLYLENVYNSKVVAGMMDWIRRGKTKGNVCFLHTGGFGSLFAQFEQNGVSEGFENNNNKKKER